MRGGGRARAAPRIRPPRARGLAALVLAVLLPLAAGPAAAQEKVLNLYSARHYQTDEKLYGDFTKSTGIAINRIELGDEALLEHQVDAPLDPRVQGRPVDVDAELDGVRVVVLQGRQRGAVGTAGDLDDLECADGTAAVLDQHPVGRDRVEGAVVVIGNAPTALFRLLEGLDAGWPRPALILGFPVGFVGAAESKAELAANPRGVPFVTLRGRRGGSAMAAAAVNVMSYRTAEAAVVAPMQYSQIAWAAFYGWILFGELPDAMTILGLSVIAAAGVYILWREAGGNSRVSPVTTSDAAGDAQISPRTSFGPRVFPPRLTRLRIFPRRR